MLLRSFEISYDNEAPVNNENYQLIVPTGGIMLKPRKDSSALFYIKTASSAWPLFHSIRINAARLAVVVFIRCSRLPDR